MLRPFFRGAPPPVLIPSSSRAAILPPTPLQLSSFSSCVQERSTRRLESPRLFWSGQFCPQFLPPPPVSLQPKLRMRLKLESASWRSGVYNASWGSPLSCHSLLLTRTSTQLNRGHGKWRSPRRAPGRTPGLCPGRGRRDAWGSVCDPPGCSRPRTSIRKGAIKN